MSFVCVSWLFERHPHSPGMSYGGVKMFQFFISPGFIFRLQYNVCSVCIAALVRICPVFIRNKQPRGRCAHYDEDYLDYKRGQVTAKL